MVMPSVSQANSYTLGKVLCKTYFGRVHLARSDNREVVCKISNRTLIQNARDGTIEDPTKEVDFLRKLQIIRQIDHNPGCDNFIGLIDSFQDATHDWTVLEYAQRGDLFEMVDKGHLHGNKAMSKHFFRQIALGVHFLHTYHIVHRDLSLENIFITDNNTVKIGDFGQAKQIDVDEEGRVKPWMNYQKERPGKPGYMAPEIHDGVEYDPKSADVFALGVSLFVCLAGIPPFGRADRSDRCWKHIRQGNLQKLVNAWKLDIDEQSIDLIQGMLTVETNRLTLEQVLSHPFLDESFYP